MPTYELALVFQKLEREGLKIALKRSANYIFDIDGTLRSIENLGFRNTAYKMTKHGKHHRVGHFFIFNYDAGFNEVKNLKDQLMLDLDVIRARNFLRAKDPFELHIKPEKPECTKYLDCLPPPFRPSVLAIQKAGQKKKLRRSRDYNDPEFLI